MKYRCYRVYGMTKKGGIKTYEIDLVARDFADAKKAARAFWDRENKGCHIFDLRVKSLNNIRSGHSGKHSDWDAWRLTGETMGDGTFVSYGSLGENL